MDVCVVSSSWVQSIELLKETGGPRGQCLLFLDFLCDRCGDRDEERLDLRCGDGERDRLDFRGDRDLVLKVQTYKKNFVSLRLHSGINHRL